MGETVIVNFAEFRDHATDRRILDIFRIGLSPVHVVDDRGSLVAVA